METISLWDFDKEIDCNGCRVSTYQLKKPDYRAEIERQLKAGRVPHEMENGIGTVYCGCFTHYTVGDKAFRLKSEATKAAKKHY